MNIYALWQKWRRLLKYTAYILLSIGAAFCIWYLAQRPSNDRDWALDQAVLPYAEVEDGIATVHNIRNFSYKTTTEYTPDYYDATYDIRALEKVYYIVEPFSGYKGAAHTFLSFEFNEGKFLAVSVEIRKEKGESFSAVKGLLRQYEIMYVLADERDVVKLRSNMRKDDVFVYPIKTTKERMQATFYGILERVNQLYREPEFYNTITNNCTTSLAKQANQVVEHRIPWNLTLLFPKESDRYAFDLGLFDTKLTSFPEVRRAHYINNLAERYADDEEFSLRIRGR
ncbi:MAG: hypothetical protein COV91_05735 [Candidatus Taylorbacteria bacterium CG11_big_fil_rev_8_21_14_0_20_46_11]|uniref:Lnb N-terminal periplasmic domain-containing protein n=1 Tax=Candidatus Taylorbacteria bacterium CG11_big_fil_rev_8_21_14_0_20_46_11 TaxID=1975025 RepID=A0A2H0KC23_9BACT|nr:MAG: hypothetical protein COV91_05735 [Candidatus Taylorbacteria bacterium CG11_big_fil_rev_8_21_14_0_20_46_11]